MKIIEQVRAPNPRRVRIFLAEKGLEVPFEQIDMMQMQHRADDFTRLNPMQQVPVLVLDDGTAISETMAICRYIEELHPEPSLFGRTPLERAMVEMWNRRIEYGLFFRVAQTFRHTHPAMAPLEVPQVAAWGEANREKALEQLGLLDRELAGRPYIAGDSYSVADITALVATDFMKPAKIERPKGLDHFDRWYASVAGRPSAKA
jgi:glutathione S-transferase